MAFMVREMDESSRLDEDWMYRTSQLIRKADRAQFATEDVAVLKTTRSVPSFHKKKKSSLLQTISNFGSLLARSPRTAVSHPGSPRTTGSPSEFEDVRDQYA